MKKNKLTISIISITIILTILLLDQIVKIWIKTHFAIGDEIKITNFFYLHFIENEGMAFGMSFFDIKYLTLFRIVASIGIAYYIYKSIKNNSEQLFIISLSLIFAGAIGNIIDRIKFGYVIDFIAVGRFPVFNVADSAVTIGVFLMIIYYLIEERKALSARKASGTLENAESNDVSEVGEEE